MEPFGVLAFGQPGPWGLSGLSLGLDQGLRLDKYAFLFYNGD
jgi:hypothetical protein